MSDSFLSDEQQQAVVYSVIVPVYNEEESLEPLLAELLQVMTPLNKRYEIIFVNDYSDDQSPEILKGFQEKLPEVVLPIHLDERCGQTYAMRRGLNEAKGEVAFTLDADLQNDPTDIPKLIAQMEKGSFDCVCGWRKARHDKFLKAHLSKAGNFLQRALTGLTIHDVSCTLRAYKRHCVSQIALHREGMHRFIPLSLSLQGFKIGEIISNHRDRKFGATKYSHKRLFKVVRDFFSVLKNKGKAS